MCGVSSLLRGTNLNGLSTMLRQMEYYFRPTRNNVIGLWQEADSHHRRLIIAYFRQPIRDHPVDIRVEDDDGNEVLLQCMAETNDKITGTLDGVHIEIVQCRRDRVEETLARYP